MRRLTALGATFTIAILALSACSSSASPSAGATQAASAPASVSASVSASDAGAGSAAGAGAVTIKGFAFNPADFSVKVGTKVTWTNQDSAGHTVTFDTGNVASETLQTGATYSRTFDAAGTFTYHCSIHPAMKATVTVTGT